MIKDERITVTFTRKQLFELHDRARRAGVYEPKKMHATFDMIEAVLAQNDEREDME